MCLTAGCARLTAEKFLHQPASNTYSFGQTPLSTRLRTFKLHSRTQLLKIDLQNQIAPARWHLLRMQCKKSSTWPGYRSFARVRPNGVVRNPRRACIRSAQPALRSGGGGAHLTNLELKLKKVKKGLTPPKYREKHSNEYSHHMVNSLKNAQKKPQSRRRLQQVGKKSPPI